MSSRGPQKTSKKFFRSADQPPSFPPAVFLAGFFLRDFDRIRSFNSFKRSFVSDDEQRLARRAQQVEKLAAARCAHTFPCRPSASVMAPPPPIASNSRTPNLRRSVSSSMRILTTDNPLRRRSASTTSSNRSTGEYRRSVNPPASVRWDAIDGLISLRAVPPLQLAGEQAGDRGHLARAVVLLQIGPHGQSAVIAPLSGRPSPRRRNPSGSCPPSLCVL